MSQEAYHAWLKGRSIDPAQLMTDPGRYNQFRNFFEHEQANPPIVSCPDAAGKEIKLGDGVRIQFKITGIHAVTGPDGNVLPNVFDVNLSVGDRHAISVRNTQIHKT